MTRTTSIRTGRSVNRARLLAGVGTAVFASIAAQSANAAETEYNLGIPSVTGQYTSQATVTNPGSAIAVIPGTAMTINTGTQNATNNLVNNNQILGTATGNKAVAIITGIEPESNGIASLVVEENSGIIASTVSGASLTIAIDEAPTGTAQIANNIISSTASVNHSRSLVEAPIGGGDSSPTAGDTLFIDFGTPGGGIYQAEATIATQTVQANDEGGNGTAFNTNSTLSLNVDVDGGGAIAIPTVATINDNLVTAGFSGNDANTGIVIEDGGNPVFEGSAAVLSYQYNGQDTNENFQTLVSGTNITGFVGSSAADAGDPTFNGTLSVTGNRITGASSGNSALGALDGDGNATAGNKIVLEGTESFLGVDGQNQDNLTVFFPGFLILDVEAGLVINSVQQNINSDNLNSRLLNNLIQGQVQTATGGTLDVSDNLISAAASSNTVFNSISNDGPAASFAGSAAIANFQSNYGDDLDTETRARNINGDVIALVGDGNAFDQVDGTTVLLDGNAVLSSATGNAAVNVLDLDANTVDIGTAPADLALGFFGPVLQNSDGSLTINNAQVNVDSPTTSRNSLSQIQISADNGAVDGSVVIDSTLSASGNTQESFASGNSAGNTLTLNGNSVGTGAGINNAQGGDNVIALFLGSTSIVTSFDVAASDLSVDDNLQRARAFGNSAANGLSVTANAITLDPAGAEVASSVDTDVSTTSAGYAVQNVQGQFGTVDADIFADSEQNVPQTDPLLFVDVGNGLSDGASIGIDGNGIGTGAFGNDAANTLDLAVNNLDVIEDGFAHVAAITNGQYLGADVSSIVNPETNAIQVTVAADVEGSSTITANENALEATAVGNRTTRNDLTVSGNNIASAASGIDQRGFVNNDAPIEADAAFVVQNVQLNEAESVEAFIGSGINGGVPDIFIDLDLGVEDAVVSADGNGFAARATGNSASSSLAFDRVNNLQATAALQNFQETDGSVTATAGDLESDSGIEIDAGSVGDPDGRRIVDSTLSISGNDRTATAIGNDGSVTMDIVANSMLAAGNGLSAFADNLGAGADFTVGNFQDVTGALITANASSILVISSEGDTNVSGSSFDIVGNTQSAVAVGNTGDNALSIVANNMLSGGEGVGINSALVSVQRGGDGETIANSGLLISTPAEVSGSAINLSDNRNTALGVINDVINTVDIKASNIEGLNDATANADFTGPESDITSDHVLNSIQTSSGEVGANAFTLIGNADTGTANMNASSFSVTGNVTATEATANRAENTLTINGLASNQASAGVANYQDSSTIVDSTASTSINLFGAPADDSSIADSSASLNDNTTSALARGNSALNALNYSGGSLSPTVNTLATSSLNGSALTGTANALVLNAQNNAGAVTATATKTIGVTLNGSPNAASASSISASGNVVNASGYGNYAVNTLTTTGILNGASAGIASNQVNSATVTATASGVNIAITAATGAVVGSSLGITGNTVSATAIGNSVTNIMTAH